MLENSLQSFLENSHYEAKINMTTLHMDTNSVNGSAQQMKQSIERMKEQTQNLMNNTQSMNWLGPSRDEFISEVQHLMQSISVHLDNGSILVNRAEREADEWENTASTLAGAYGGIFDGIKGISLPASSIPAMIFAASSFNAINKGSVLGAATTINEVNAAGVGGSNSVNYTAQYQAMPWNSKFAEQKKLDAEIASVARAMPPNAKEDLQKLDADIAILDQQITEIQSKRDEAYAKSKGLLNKVVPDWPLEADNEDGMPWRVRADDYEDQVAEFDGQLAELQRQRKDLFSARNSLQSEIDKLTQLNNQKAALNDVIDQGIASDGPTQPEWYKNRFGGCTNYVAEKRDLYLSQDIRISGNAQDWRDSAISAGWEVGKQPAKGSIMVFQGEASKDFNTANRATGGHVAYVENVSISDNGNYKVTISEASTIFRQDGSFVRGTHTEVKTRTIEVPADGHKYVDFIYDKP